MSTDVPSPYGYGGYGDGGYGTYGALLMSGVADSTFVSELNRLANGGGSYPSQGAYLDEAGAADKWCSTTYGNVIGALNAKAGNAVGSRLDLNGVANQLAGTSGLEVVEALRTIAS